MRSFDQESTLPDFVDFPSPIILQPPPIYWPSQPSTVLFDQGGIRELHDYNPTPKGVPSTELENILKSLPSSPYAESFIKSSRLYSTALELIDIHTEIAYELLIFSIEALANPVFSDFTPTEQELAAAKPIVAQLTKKLGLTGEQSLAMLTAASSGMNWSQKKYLRFIMENISSEELAEKDDLFNWDQDLAPKTLSEIQSRLTKTYRARGSSLHQGEQFPVRSRISLSRVPARELTKYYFGDKEIPPIEWMERVTNFALTSFLKKNLGISSASKDKI